jgi:hypothetical protein
MIANLKETLPGHRQDELEHQLSLLDREAKRLFRYPEELALASIPDSQGLGGHSSKSIPNALTQNNSSIPAGLDRTTRSA